MECSDSDCFVPSDLNLNQIIENDSVRKISLDLDRTLLIEKRSLESNKDLVFSSS
ncbi:MAG: hypothetical protein ACPGU5_00900 [Lishizhenia sp.]